MIKRCTGRRLSVVSAAAQRMIYWSCRGARILLPRRRGRFVLKFCSSCTYSRKRGAACLGGWTTPFSTHVASGRGECFLARRFTTITTARTDAALMAGSGGRAAGEFLHQRGVVVVAVRPRLNSRCSVSMTELSPRSAAS